MYHSYLSIYLLKDILVASKFWQLWRKLPETFLCRFLHVHKFSICWSDGQGVHLIVCMLNFIRNCQTVFQSGCTILYFHHLWMKTPVAPLPCQHLGVVSVLKFGYFNRCVVISHFNLQVPNDIWWTSQVVLVVKNLPANAGDIGDVCLIPGLGRSPGGGHGNPLQYFYLKKIP